MICREREQRERERESNNEGERNMRRNIYLLDDLLLHKGYKYYWTLQEKISLNMNHVKDL